MADPICRWRNTTRMQIVEFSNILPYKPMPKAEAHKYIEERWLKWNGTNNFFKTPYQLALQLGLYYEDDNFMYPRFDHVVTLEEADAYIQNWIRRYYVPNPYTASFPKDAQPLNLNETLFDRTHQKGVDLEEFFKENFKVEIGNKDILYNLLNQFSDVKVEDGIATRKPNIESVPTIGLPENHIDKKTFFEWFGPLSSSNTASVSIDSQEGLKYLNFITAIRTKPFVLLAGMSGTGKSRIVRELARACWKSDSPQHKAHKPENYEIIQVKPNWHDSNDLIGYISRISGKPQYVPGKFIEFIAKAWEHPQTPYFLCLDEMNLAPVEHYFAEFLSVLETRKLSEQGIKTDPIIPKSDKDWYTELVNDLTKNKEVQTRFLTEGISIPQNLIVMGTVNMDETACTFSRKVLDRAMTIEMNQVDLSSGLDLSKEEPLFLEASQVIGDSVEGSDVYNDNREMCDRVVAYLNELNQYLDYTPFKIAYRTRNEFLVYAANRLRLSSLEAPDTALTHALDEMTSMKILSRIEGDEIKIPLTLFKDLTDVIQRRLNIVSDEAIKASPSLSKIKEMDKKLKDTGSTSFWS